jgi:hypothetical protein
MNHHEAVRQAAVEKYLLSEMLPAERDEFEEHYFGCRDCAADLRATAAFLDEVNKELGREAAAGRSTPKFVPVGSRSWAAFLWRPAFVAPAFALLLVIIVYQNFPGSARVAGETARMGLPEILPTLSLIGAGSRGGPIPVLTASKGQPALVLVDIPAAEQFSRYDCALLAPGGAALWRVSIAPEQARDTVSIRIPAEHWERGDYTLLVQGFAADAPESPVKVATYRFTVNTSD